MITVTMEKMCGCFRRAGYEEAKSFENKDDALLYAQEICAEMNETFCQKHAFSVAETDEQSMLIRLSMNN